MKEPKRKPLKGKLAPRNATTFSKICSLETDNNSTRYSWISLSEKSVSIVNQKSGESSSGVVHLTRKEFEKFIDWYNKKQQTFK